MKTKYRTEQIVESIKAHPFTEDHITLESGLSWPVPVTKDDKLILSFFYYPSGGPRGNRVIGWPYYRALADPDSLENIQFTHIERKEFGLEIPEGQPVGREDGYYHYLDDLTRDQYNTLVDQFYNLIDELLPIYLKPVPTLSRDEKQVVAEYYSLFHKLTLDPLWPVYRAVNPEFFDWVEAVSEAQ
ncbi:MAG TPA: hypothetical protein VJ302_37820 [Blastocatellia bacterium]|nr:hypothetical protein [Blastocatellia bacterium]